MDLNSSTLYKLMVLYMLKQVNFPLTQTQLAGFFLSYEYTNFFEVQKVLSELQEAKLINIDTKLHNSSRHTLTKDGSETLELFRRDIPEAVISDLDKYLNENKFKMRDEVSSIADYYHDSDTKEYVVTLRFSEAKYDLIAIDISVPDETVAENMCANWHSKSQDIYQYIFKKLMN